MLNKKKIIWSAVGGAAAVTSGLAIGIPVNAIQQQAATIDAPSSLESKAPNSDEFTYEMETSNQDDLNAKLSTFFEGKKEISDFNNWFTNISEYSNVSISYKNDSANFEHSSFEINVKPIENSYWSNGSSEIRIIPVALTNLVKNNSQQPDIPTPPPITPSVLKDASVPESAKYNQSIEAKDGEVLESWLKQNFDSKNLKNFENVSVTYKDDSSNFKTKTFKVVVTPLDGHEWKNGTTDAKEVEVSVEIIIPAPVLKNDASIPATATYSEKIKVSNDTEFNEYLNKNFKVENLSGTFSNVDIKYINNSANVNSKSFKISATPKNGYAWNDLSTSEKELTITADVTVSVVARIPDVWTVNGIGKSSYYQNYSVDELGRLAYKDLSAAYPNLLLYGVNNNEPQGKININGASVIYFQIILGVNDPDAVKSQTSFENFHTYINGGTVKYETQTQNVKVYVFLDDAIGVNGYLTDSWLTYTPVNDSNGLPGQWVSNFIVSTNTSGSIVPLMTQQILADLRNTYPDYYVSAGDFIAVNSYYGTWTYKIKFMKNNKIVKEITGYTFTRS